MKVPSPGKKIKQSSSREPFQVEISVFFLLIVITIYVRKEEEKIYNALLLDDPTVDGLKQQVTCCKMIQNLFFYF